MEARKLNPLLPATDKFQLQKMHPIVGDHLLFSDRKRIITSLRGRGTDMPFRLGRECRSLIGSLRNNFVLCLSFTFKSRARFAREDSEMTVLGSALSQGSSYCTYGIAASFSSSEKEKPQKCVKISPFYIPSLLPKNRQVSFIHVLNSGALCVPSNVRHLCRLMLNDLFTSCLRGRLVFSDKP